jgi:hypothetical protein
VGEITTGALLYVKYMGKDHQAGVSRRFVVVPRPALVPLAEAMGKLVVAESGKEIRKRAEAGAEVHRGVVDPP